MAKAADMTVEVQLNKEVPEKIDLIFKEVQALRAEIKTLKMNLMQMNALRRGA